MTPTHTVTHHDIDGIDSVRKVMQEDCDRHHQADLGADLKRQTHRNTVHTTVNRQRRSAKMAAPGSAWGVFRLGVDEYKPIQDQIDEETDGDCGGDGGCRIRMTRFKRLREKVPPAIYEMSKP